MTYEQKTVIVKNKKSVCNISSTKSSSFQISLVADFVVLSVFIRRTIFFFEEEEEEIEGLG